MRRVVTRLSFLSVFFLHQQKVAPSDAEALERVVPSTLRDIDALPQAVREPLAAAAGKNVVITDDGGDLDADDLDVIGALNRVAAGDESDLCDLGDNFMLLANDGLIGGAALSVCATHARACATHLCLAQEANLTRAQLAARADMLAEMMDSDEGVCV